MTDVRTKKPNFAYEKKFPQRGVGDAGGVATVKLLLSDSPEEVITRAWGLTVPLYKLRMALARDTQLPPTILQISYGGSVVNDNTTLQDLYVTANSTVQLMASSLQPLQYPLKLKAPVAGRITTPDVITVVVMKGSLVREVVVEVEWMTGSKPWLGGFQHKSSGLHYHNAATQTQHHPRPRGSQVSRGTQTSAWQPLGTQTSADAQSQTSFLHPLVIDPNATLITPREYIPADTYNIQKIVIVQCCVRRWLAQRRYLAQQSKAMEHSDAGKVQDDSLTQISRSDQATATHEPKKAGGGQMMSDLYNRLESWRRQQVIKINSEMTGNEKRKALVALLEKETELLRQLENHRALRSARRRGQAIENFLQEVSRAQVWGVGGFGGGVEVETPDTGPVRMLASLAQELMTESDVTSRTNQFNMLSHTIQVFKPSRGDPASMARMMEEVVTLSMRGVFLLSRGTPDQRLRGLRKRLHTLIINYLHQVQGRVSPVVRARCLRAAGAKPVLIAAKSS
ncbi:unnamed protein product, partial [Meganyctiphanes norvegica]